MARWVRRLQALKEFEPDEYAQVIYLIQPDVTRIMKADLAFRLTNDRNLVLQIKGPTGSGKSTVGCAVARWLVPEWRPKGYTYYSEEDLINAARRADRNAVFVKDEDPRRHGQGSIALDDAMANIESAVARWAQMHFIFINPYETGHLVHFVLDTSREEATYRQNGMLASVVVTVRAKTDNEEWIKVGKMEVRAPPEEILQEYKEEMASFKQKMKLTGGFGLKAQILKSYEYLWDRSNPHNLIDDPDFWVIPLNRDALMTEKHARYISRAHGIIKSDADLLVLFKQKDLIAEKGFPTPQKS
jgi:hypothetical protein